MERTHTALEHLQIAGVVAGHRFTPTPHRRSCSGPKSIGITRHIFSQHSQRTAQNGHQPLPPGSRVSIRCHMSKSKSASGASQGSNTAVSVGIAVSPKPS